MRDAQAVRVGGISGEGMHPGRFCRGERISAELNLAPTSGGQGARLIEDDGFDPAPVQFLNQLLAQLLRSFSSEGNNWAAASQRCSRACQISTICRAPPNYASRKTRRAMQCFYPLVSKTVICASRRTIEIVPSRRRFVISAADARIAARDFERDRTRRGFEP